MRHETTPGFSAKISELDKLLIQLWKPSPIRPFSHFSIIYRRTGLEVLDSLGKDLSGCRISENLVPLGDGQGMPSEATLRRFAGLSC